MIGGNDNIIKGEFDNDTKKIILDLVKNEWNDMAVEDLSFNEFFIYKNENIAKSWNDNGASFENEDQMIHVILTQNELTFIVGGAKTARIIDKIKLLLIKCEECDGKPKNNIWIIQKNNMFCSNLCLLQFAARQNFEINDMLDVDLILIPGAINEK